MRTDLDGVLTYLFSDIEGSTSLWERHPDEMRAALAAHDELTRRLVEGAGGEVVKSTGDGFMAVFAQPVGAVTAAAEISRELARLDDGLLRARMGIHSGPSSPRDGDYFGTEVNRAARLMSCANGGQLVVSEAAWFGLGAALPEGLSSVDAGRHRLKDLTEPIRIFQILGEGCDDRRPLRTVDATPNNLPVQASSFVGRADDIGELVQMVPDHRLTTLVGLGGLGKTRLALQVGAELLHRFPDGVWLLPLEDLSDPDLLGPTALAELGLPADPARDPVDQLTEHFSTRTALLIVDNCEHMLDGAAALVHRLLRASAGLSVVATSRESLGVPGERQWPVRPLPADGAAVELFEERAQLVRPGFTVDQANRQTVIDLCDGLDGIPLAIELAAARLKMLDLEQVAARLGERFRLLTGGARPAADRQRTLEATLTWSHDLLSGPEQAVLRRISVFSGGFDLEAAEFVAAGDDLATVDVLDLLGRLVESSLVVFETSPVSRYRMLETVRLYGQVRLEESGEADEARLRHATHFAQVAAEVGDDLQTNAARSAAARAARERANLRSAMAWAYDAGHSALGLRIAVGRRLFAFVEGAFTESLDAIARGLDLEGELQSEDEIRGLAYAITDAANLCDDVRVEPLLEAAERLVDGISDPILRADLTGAMAGPARLTDPRATDRVMVELIDAYRRAGSTRWMLPFFNRVSNLMLTADKSVGDELRTLCQDAAEIDGGVSMPPWYLEALLAVFDDRPGDALALVEGAEEQVPDFGEQDRQALLADIHQALGQLEDARTAFRHSYPEHPVGNDAVWRGLVGASLALDEGHLDEVVGWLEPVRHITRSPMTGFYRAALAVAHAGLAAGRGDLERAAVLAGFWQPAEAAGFGLKPHERRRLDATLSAARAVLGDGEMDWLLEAGARMAFEDLPLYEE